MSKATSNLSHWVNPNTIWFLVVIISKWSDILPGYNGSHLLILEASWGKVPQAYAPSRSKRSSKCQIICRRGAGHVRAACNVRRASLRGQNGRGGGEGEREAPMATAECHIMRNHPLMISAKLSDFTDRGSYSQIGFYAGNLGKQGDS